MPQLVYTDPSFQVAASNLGRLFSPQAAAQGRLMQAQQGQIDSATALNQARALTEGQRLAEIASMVDFNKARTLAETAEAERAAEMYRNRAGVVDNLQSPLLKSLVGVLPGNDLYRLNDMSIDQNAVQAMNAPGIGEGDARIQATILSRGNAPGVNDAITQDGVQNAFNLDRDRALAVEAARGENDLISAIATAMQNAAGDAEVERIRNAGAMALQKQKQLWEKDNPSSSDGGGLSEERRRQEFFGSLGVMFDQMLSNVKGAITSKNNSGGLSLETAIDPQVKAAVVQRAFDYAIANKEPAQSALSKAIADTFQNGLDDVYVDFNGIWPRDKHFSFKNPPNLFNSPAPAAQLPPANAPVSPSTPQGAAPGAGDSESNPLPLPKKNGKVDRSQLIKGKYYIFRNGVIDKF